ncbi:MAG: hypothetical protein HRU13_04840 [Phycisphaerales bacterium]|nr:hypothetical protein [Phycisphaerales bacterium]
MPRSSALVTVVALAAVPQFAQAQPGECQEWIGDAYIDKVTPSCNWIIGDRIVGSVRIPGPVPPPGGCDESTLPGDLILGATSSGDGALGVGVLGVGGFSLLTDTLFVGGLGTGTATVYGEMECRGNAYIASQFTTDGPFGASPNGTLQVIGPVAEFRSQDLTVARGLATEPPASTALAGGNLLIRGGARRDAG